MLAYSIVIETENLANGDLAELRACLDSLAAQGLDRRPPNEVIIVESGQVAPEALALIQRAYPWLAVHVASRPLHYYEAKLEGAARATGEVVVFADADLRYSGGWLDTLLAPFEDPEVNFVTGETRIDITGPYTFSVATTWIFPRRYGRGPAPSLIANNCAVRRAALLAHPFPTALPLYRTQIVLHGRMLRSRGLRILRVRAAGLHAPPAGAREWALRYIVSGADVVEAAKYEVGTSDDVVASRTAGGRARALVQGVARKLTSSAVRTLQAIAERPTRVVYLPLALPISAAALLLFVGGAISAGFGSRTAYRWIHAFEQAAGGVRTADAEPIS